MENFDSPEYHAHLCGVIASVFRAEHNLNEHTNLSGRLKSGEITPDEYISEIATEMINTYKRK